jgi:hypothetical protein
VVLRVAPSTSQVLGSLGRKVVVQFNNVCCLEQVDVFENVPGSEP